MEERTIHGLTGVDSISSKLLRIKIVRGIDLAKKDIFGARYLKILFISMFDKNIFT